ncbi:MAG TPA: energy-coupling factor ABC transporter permease, partial [Armatimonadota bacterium]
MSHIHLPDGILPTWLWMLGYLAAALSIGTMWRWGRVKEEPRRFSLLGIFSAIMILVMMIEIPPVSYHFNLSIVAGIVLGPQLSILAALIVNVILSLIGHGGITVVGVNTLVLSSEMLAGYYLFRLFMKFNMRVSTAGFAATM